MNEFRKHTFEEWLELFIQVRRCSLLCFCISGTLMTQSRSVLLCFYNTVRVLFDSGWELHCGGRGASSYHPLERIRGVSPSDHDPSRAVG